MRWTRTVAVALAAAVLSFGLPAVPALGVTLTVNSNADPGVGGCDVTECTLREAITAANVASDLDSIAFGIGSGAQTITVGSPLPTITNPVSIDGTTQPGYAGTPLIAINGADLVTIGLNVTGGDSVIRGLVVNRFVTVGIYIVSSGNSVTNSYIGTDVTGTVDLGNGTGVDVPSPGNTIGGTTGTTPNGACTGDCNVISGNGIGVNIGLNANNNQVLGNFIGSDVTGTVDLGNSDDGISIGPGGSGAIVGNGTAAGRNVISGNDGDGVRLIGGGSHTVQGNYIGTNGAGNADLGNAERGLATTSSSALNAIGGSSPGQGNLVSGNDGGGIAIGTFTNTVWGNLIGSKADGLTALANTGAGMTVGPNAGNNVIGGTDVGRGNTIAFNSGEGVRVEGGYFANNKIRGNSIHSNLLKGIEIVPGAGDFEPPIPVITAVGSASGTSCANCTIDVFSDSADEGRAYKGTVIADDNGDSTGDWSYFGPVSGPNVTATATDPGGGTSEFSAAFACGDFDTDSIDNCSDTDDDNDGFVDALEDGTPLCGNAQNEDSFDDPYIDDGCPAVGSSEYSQGPVLCEDNDDNDGDGFLNDGCPQVGAYSEAQFDIGTGALDPCGNNGWPADLQANNKLDIGDFNSFLFPLRGNGSFNKFGHPVPDPDDANIARWNLQWGGVTTSQINIGDLNALNPAVAAPTAQPPMFGGLPAFFTNAGSGVGGCPFPP